MKHVYVTLTPVEADKLSSIKLSGRCKDFTGVRVNKGKWLDQYTERVEPS